MEIEIKGTLTARSPKVLETVWFVITSGMKDKRFKLYLC